VLKGFEQVATQAPLLQTGVPPEQAFPQAPQLLASESRFTQDVPHAVPTLQVNGVQVPPTQMLPAEQALPHVPQWSGSFCRSAQ